MILVPYYVNIPINPTPFYTGKFMEELHRGAPKAFLVRLQAFFLPTSLTNCDLATRGMQLLSLAFLKKVT